MDDLREYIGPTEAAGRIGISTVTLKDWAARKRHGLRSVRVAGRLLFHRADVVRIARERQAAREGELV